MIAADRRTSRRSSKLAAAATAVLLAVSALALAPSGASAALRAGDVGFSFPSSAGPMWVYGDSWIDGRFIRNAITLSGHFSGEIKNVPDTHWVWPGAPFALPNGRIGMYGAEMRQESPGMWGFKTVRGIRATFMPNAAWQAEVTPTNSALVWSAAATRSSTNPIVYAVDSAHRAHSGWPSADGSVKEIRNMGGLISGQFSVIPDDNGRWWMVGQLPFLSRRVVAYRLVDRTGPVVGDYVPLATLPDPGANRFTYAATLHPEYGGLMTWAVNGSGPGTPYGLQRVNNFWPTSINAALTLRAAAAKAATVARASRTATIAKVARPTQQEAAARRDLVDIQNRIDTQEEADRIEVEVEQAEGWLTEPPTQLDPGQDPESGSPAVREYSGRGEAVRSRRGEDQSSDRQAGYRIAKGRERVKVGEDRTASRSKWSDLYESSFKLPNGRSGARKYSDRYSWLR